MTYCICTMRCASSRQMLLPKNGPKSQLTSILFDIVCCIVATINYSNTTITNVTCYCTPIQNNTNATTMSGMSAKILR